MFNHPDSPPAVPPSLDAFIERVQRLAQAFEAQSEELKRLQSALESARLENEKLAAQCAENAPTGQGQLNLDTVQDSKPTHLPQSHQSAPPSIDRNEVQALLSEIETCIAILES